MRFSDVERLSGKGKWYPGLDKMLEICEERLAVIGFSKTEAWQILREVFAGLTEAEVKGLIHIGDEHEWACASVNANAMLWHYATKDEHKPATLKLGSQYGSPAHKEAAEKIRLKEAVRRLELLSDNGDL